MDIPEHYWRPEIIVRDIDEQVAEYQQAKLLIPCKLKSQPIDIWLKRRLHRRSGRIDECYIGFVKWDNGYTYPWHLDLPHFPQLISYGVVDWCQLLQAGRDWVGETERQNLCFR